MNPALQGRQSHNVLTCNVRYGECGVSAHFSCQAFAGCPAEWMRLILNTRAAPELAMPIVLESVQDCHLSKPLKGLTANNVSCISYHRPGGTIEIPVVDAEIIYDRSRVAVPRDMLSNHPYPQKDPNQTCAWLRLELPEET